MTNKLWLIVLVLMLNACSDLYNLRAPQVSVTDVSLNGGNLLEQRFKLKLRVTNPNDRDIVVDGLVFDVLIGDRQFAHGISNTSTVLPKLADAVVEVEGTAQSLSLLQQLLEQPKGSDRLPYRIKGEVVARDYGRIAFDHKSETALPWMQQKKSP